MTHYRLEIESIPEEGQEHVPFTVNYLLDSLELYTLEVGNSLFLSLEMLEATNNSIRIKFGFTDNMSGRIKYWPANNPEDVKYTIGEYSSFWGDLGNEHVQTAGSLVQNTEYFFVSQTIQNDLWIDVSSPFSFFTTDVISTTWPGAGSDPNLRFHGAFAFGSYAYGIKTAHTILGESKYIALRYRMPKSGTIKRIGFHARYDNDGQNLQASGYSVGNGGNYDIDVMTMGSDGNPDVVIGSSDRSVNRIMANGPFNASNLVWVDMQTQPTVTAGQDYFIYRSVKDPAHWAVWNGYSLGEYFQSHAGMGQRGPWPGDSNLNMKYKYKTSPNASWQDSARPNVVPLLFIEFTDGSTTGNIINYVSNINVDVTFAQANNNSSGTSASRYIGGSRRAMVVFNQEMSCQTDGVHINFGHHDYNSATGAPLIVELKTFSGVVLSTATIEFNPAMSQAATSTNHNVVGNFPIWLAKTWGYASFNPIVSLTGGQDYIIEISSASMDYVLTAGHSWLNQDPNTGYSDTDERWNASLHYSSDSGANWGGWCGVFDDGREIPILLTRVGFPKAF